MSLKNLLLGVDPQDCFMKHGGALYVEGAEDLAFNMELIKVTARQYNIKQIFTSDGHLSSDEELSENPDYKNTFPEHALIELNDSGKKITSYSEGFKIDDRIADWSEMIENIRYIARGEYTNKQFNDIVHNNRSFLIIKNVFNVFKGNAYTERIFKELNPRTVFVYGVTADICVDHAVNELIERNYHVVVIQDAIKELSSTACMTEWKNKGVEFTTTFELIDELKK